MSEKRISSKKKKVDEEVENILDMTWDNWSSRRQCEQTHTPEYIKREKKKKNYD